MAKRRAISEVIAVILLIAVIATASFLALNGASKKTIEKQHSVDDMLEFKSSQIQEMLSIISKKSIGNITTVELLNYGLKDITVTEVLVDGIGSSYILVDSSGTNQANKIIRKEILTLQIPKSSQTIQIITNTKNILRISI
jgi:flagellin-like protein